MAIRYCGNVKLRITIENDGGLATPASYRVACSVEKSHRETVKVQAQAPGVAIDSPTAFDFVARAALNFAGESVQEDAEWTEDGWLVRTRK